MRMLEGKAVVITGAGAGLGRAYALHAARHGALLVVNDRDAAAAEKVAAEIVAAGGEAIARTGDVGEWSLGEALVEACVSRFGGIDGLVTNAGILRHGQATDITEADLRAMIDVNLVGTAACASAAIRAMLKGGRPGSILMVTSGSQAGDIALGGYGATKAGVAALAFSWAMELRDTPVRVNALSPLAHTAMAQSNMGFLARQSAERDVVYTTLPPAEANAPAVVFLLSDAAHAVRGQIVRIAGRQLSFVTHPMIADPVLEGDWDDGAVADGFARLIAHQKRLGLTFERGPGA